MSNVIVLEPQPHSPLGPSSSKRWLSCPGSVLATKGMPDTESEYAAEGTVAHAVSEWCRKHLVDAAKYLDTEVQSGKYKFTVDREMVDGVNEFCEYVADLDGIPLVEVLVKYDRWVPEGFGTLDHATLAEVCHIADFKYGQGVQVFARDNEQLKLYALGILVEWDWLFQFTRFVLHICQPRLHHFDRWEISREDLLAWAENVVRPGALRTKDPAAPLAAGDWCQFCKIKATCKVRAATVFNTVVGDFEDLDASQPREVARLTPEEIAQALPHLDNIKKWCGDLEKYAMAQVRTGVAIGDYKIVAGRSNRAWSENEDATALKLIELGVEEDLIYAPRELLSPAQLEGKLGKRKALIKPLITKPVGAPKLVPGSDERPPLVVDALSEFGDLGDDDPR